MCVGHLVGIIIIPIAIPYCFDPPIIFSSFPESPPRSVAFFSIPSMDLALYDLEPSLVYTSCSILWAMFSRNNPLACVPK